MCDNALSPVTSPAPQVKQHGAGNLTGHLRKVKDLTADVHNLIRKWDCLKSQGMNIMTDIANVMLNKMFTNATDGSFASPKAHPQELEAMCDSLSETIQSMESVILKMEHKVTVADGLVNLQRFQKSKPVSNVLFSTMTLEDVAETVRAIEEDYAKELKTKREIIKVVAHAENRDVVMFYLACWMHEPYVHEENSDRLKALLKDTGHLK